MDAVNPIDTWIDTVAPEPSRDKLRELAALIRSLVPAGTREKIAYGIPTWTYRGNLVHIGGYERHVSFYPGGVVEQFADELGGLKRSKGTIQFPLDEPLRSDLVRRIVEFRIAHQEAKRR